MAVIDEDGRLFGVVNVVDALVVLLVVAVLTAGIALVNPFGAEPTPEVRYATIDLGSQPSFAVEQISAGDTATYPDQPGNLTVTDVYVVPGQDPDTASTIVRARISGQLVNRTTRDAAVFDFADEPLRSGRQLDIATPEYVVSGTVTSVTSSGRSLNVTETDVLLDTTVPAATADTLTAGDTMRVGGTTVATIEAVQQYPRPDSNRRQVRVGMTLRTRQQGGETRFGPTRVAVGNTLGIRTPESNVMGTIAATGTARLPTNNTPVVLETTVSADTAAAIETGDTMRVTDTTVATIESVRVYPTGNPSQRQVQLGVTLRTRQQSGETRFGPTRVAVGNALTVQTADTSLTGTIAATGTARLPTSDTSIVLETTVSADTAAAVETGDTMRVADRTVATVNTVRVYPTGNPSQRQVQLGVTLRTRQQSGETRFGPTRVAVGNALTVQTANTSLTGTIAATGTARLPTSDTPVVLETTVSADTASTITAGDEMRVADRPIATVDSVRVYPTTDPSQRRLALGVTLETTTRDGQLTFGSRPVRVGTTVPIDTDEYSLSGPILTRGTLTPPGTAGTTTAQVELQNVPPAVANDVRVGMTETTRGETLARITDKRVEDATIVLTSENGEIFAREHPRNKDVTLTVELATRRTADGLQFHGRTLRTDTRVVFDLESVTVRGTVIELQE